MIRLPSPSLRTAFDAFARTAARHQDHDFLVTPANEGLQTRTYGQAAREVEQRRAAFVAAGLGHGHRVALHFGNAPEHILSLLALNALGASAVPLSTEHTAEETRYLITHSDADMVLTAPRLKDATAAIAKDCPKRPAVHLLDGDSALSWEQRPPLPGKPDRATEMTLLYTSGTTGKPKGCIITNDYALASGDWYASRGGRLQMDEGKIRLLNPFPLHHMNAGVMSLVGLILSANCLILWDRFHPTRWWADVVRTNANAMHYMGVIPPLLMKQEPVPEERQHQLRFGLGAGIDPDLHLAFEQRFGFPLVEVWGMTETGRMFCDCDEPRSITTRAIGRPREGFEALIADDDDLPVPSGTPGNFLVRFAGPDPRFGFFSGYLKDDAATHAAWRNGWFHTGDIAVQDGTGMLYFVDRKKNIIRRSGENIAAAEVEAAVISHPAVKAVAALAAFDALREEEVMVCIVVQPGIQPSRALAEQIFVHAVGQLAYFKAPGWVVFREHLPVTQTSKIQKRLIFAEGEDPCATALSFDFRDRKKRNA